MFLTLDSPQLGEHTTQPTVAVGISIDYAPFFSVQLAAGENEIALPKDDAGGVLSIFKKSSSVIRVNVEGWQNNRLHLVSIVLNPGAKLLRYKPSKLAFQFIGDSLTAVRRFLP